MMKKSLFGYLLLVVVYLSSCSSIAQSVVNKIDYKIVKVDINIIQNSQNIFDTFSSGDFNKLAKLKITPSIRLINNNPFDILIGETEYRVFMNNIQIAEGVTTSSLELKSHQGGTLSLPMDASMSNIVQSGFNILLSQDIRGVIIKGRNHIKSVGGNFIVNFTIKDDKIEVDSISRE